MPEPTLNAKQKRALAAALLACPTMADRAGRDAIIRELPADIQHSITRSDAGLLDVTNTISAALNHPRGLATLVDLVRLFEGDSLPMAEVERLLAELEGATPTAVQPAPALGPSGDRWVLESPVRMEFVRIPAGEFLMGSDPDLDALAGNSEQPQHCVCLAECYIGQYPVTVAQYAAFARSTRRKVDEQQGGPDHPWVNVTWHDTQVFCRWLSQRSGLVVRLPSEAEWEKAARATDGRLYPWGDEAPNQKLCNFGNNVRATTPVGMYPDGVSPYGVLDMAGNVWEWTNTLWGPSYARQSFKYPYDARDGRENPKVTGARVLRGGAFFVDARLVRCAYRDGYSPDGRSRYLGFRVVASPRHS